MLFSLIIGTLDREEEIKACLDSLFQQTERNFEVIVIDQSTSRKTEEVVKQYHKENLKYVNVAFRGLSKARNNGIRIADGEFICLVDDDAVYPPNYLADALNYCDHETILSGEIYSIEDCITPFIDCSNLSDGQILSVGNIIGKCPSAALIIPRNVIDKVGAFDERLGVGNDYASGEETDFLLRAIDLGYKTKHCKAMKIYHPIKKIDYNNLSSIFKHAMGKGALFKVDTKERKKKRLLLYALKNTLGMRIKAIFANEQNKQVYLTRCDGFLNGYRSFSHKNSFRVEI